MSYKKKNCVLCGTRVTVDDVTRKTAKTTKDFLVENYRGEYGPFTVPAGSTVSNHTACGNDDSYRFWTDFHKVVEEKTGFKDSMLRHDLTYYGLSIPAEYCEPYPEEK